MRLHSMLFLKLFSMFFRMPVAMSSYEPWICYAKPCLTSDRHSIVHRLLRAIGAIGIAAALAT